MSNYLDLKEVQLELLSILDETANYLERNNIKYFICAGTLIGAVRHQGFIPWDDDIDIGIDRKNYDKLIECLKNDKFRISKNIEAIGFELGNAEWPFIKIVNKKIMVDTDEKCDVNLWMDVFPHDCLPKKNFLYDLEILFYRRLFYAKRRMIKNPIDNNVRKGIKIFTHKAFDMYNKILGFVLKPIEFESIISKYIKVCSKYNNNNKADFMYNIIWAFNPKKRIKKEVFMKYKKFKFENIEVFGLENYDEYLSKIYGNYMELPPEDKRKTHNFKAWRVEDEQVKK